MTFKEWWAKIEDDPGEWESFEHIARAAWDASRENYAHDTTGRLTEGHIKKHGVNETPKVPKKNIKPPPQKPTKREIL